MDLKELASEYRESGDKCRVRLSELEDSIAGMPMSNTEQLRLRRKICIFSGMAREVIAISNYLSNYYERKDVYEGREPLEPESGISGSPAIYQTGRFL